MGVNYQAQLGAPIRTPGYDLHLHLPKVCPTHLAWRWSRHSERPSAPPARITASSKDALAICCTKASSKPRKGEAWNQLAWKRGSHEGKIEVVRRRFVFLWVGMLWSAELFSFFGGGRGSVVCKRPKSHWTIGPLYLNQAPTAKVRELVDWLLLPFESCS